MDALIEALAGNNLRTSRRPNFVPPNWTPPNFSPPPCGRTSRVRRAPRPSTRFRPCSAISAKTPRREGLLDTPRRVVEAFDEVYQGYHQCPAEVLNRTFGERRL